MQNGLEENLGKWRAALTRKTESFIAGFDGSNPYRILINLLRFQILVLIDSRFIRMKAGDLVRYKKQHWDGDYPESWSNQGLLLKFDKVQRTCEILDNESGKIVKKHCSDVQLVKVGHASR